MGKYVYRQLDLEISLRQALKENQFILHYQPLVNEKNQVIGAEALIRWQHPEKGLLSPAAFLDVLEVSGQILKVGAWVIESALKQLAIWFRKGIWNESQKLSINISPRQFRDSQFVDSIKHFLEKMSIPPTCLNIEVTEHNVIHNTEEAIAKMNKLIELGVIFSLDDFGTGYSSLSNLKVLPVNCIKIDKSFVDDICVNREDEAMVGSILALSDHLDLTVIAEGVETLGQLDLLKKYNCQYFQGYFFSKPLPSEEMAEYLKNNREKA